MQLWIPRFALETEFFKYATTYWMWSIILLNFGGAKKSGDSGLFVPVGDVPYFE